MSSGKEHVEWHGACRPSVEGASLSSPFIMAPTPYSSYAGPKKVEGIVSREPRSLAAWLASWGDSRTQGCLLTTNDRHQGRASHLRSVEAAHPLGGQASEGGVRATQWVHTRCHVLSQPRNFPGTSGSGRKVLGTSW